MIHHSDDMTALAEAVGVLDPEPNFIDWIGHISFGAFFGIILGALV